MSKYMQIHASIDERGATMEPVAMTYAGIFERILADHDVVTVHVSASPSPQIVIARVLRIFSPYRGVDKSMLGTDIRFVTRMGWGQERLKVGDTAMVFLSKAYTNELYEHYHLGHLFIEQIDGDQYGIYQLKDLWLDEGMPKAIREAARQDPRRPYATAIRLDALEEHLVEIIGKIHTSQS